MNFSWFNFLVYNYKTNIPGTRNDTEQINDLPSNRLPLSNSKNNTFLYELFTRMQKKFTFFKNFFTPRAYILISSKLHQNKKLNSSLLKTLLSDEFLYHPLRDSG